MLGEDYARLRRRQLNSSVARIETGRRDRLLNTLPSCPRVSVTLLEKRCHVGALPVFDWKLLTLTVSAINLRYGGPSPDGQDDG